MFDKASWHLKGRIIIAEFRDMAGLFDVKQSATAVVSMLDAGSEPPVTHIIADTTGVTDVDVSLLKLHPFKDAIEPILKHSSLGWFVLVDPDPNQVILFITQTIAEITTRRFRVVDSLDKALHFIDDIDPTIALPFTIIRD